MERFLEAGLVSATFFPVQGQLIFSTSLSESVLLATIPDFFPEGSYLIATAFMVATLALLLFPKSSLPLSLRCAFAIALLLVPSDPETFGVLLYSFWWVTLWPLIITLWERVLLTKTTLILSFAGLSSIAAGALFPLFIIKWLITRERKQLFLAIPLLTTFVIQASIYLRSERGEQGELLPLRSLRQTVEYPGEYMLAWLPGVESGFFFFTGGLFWFGLILLTIWVLKDPTSNHSMVVLSGALLILAGLSSIPEPTLAQPTTSAGARYFFLPFIVISWLLLFIIYYFPSDFRKIAIIILSLSALTLGTSFARSHDDLAWRATLSALCDGKSHQEVLTFHTTGAKDAVWTLLIRQRDCPALGR